MEIITKIVLASWSVLVEVGPYVLFGFFVAGLLKAYVSDSFLAKHLGGNSVTAVVKAAVIGVPLPLCSCGVLPAALGLRRQGASKGATTSFMIATPETGVDSMAVTYALIDPLMTIIRPVAATITAIFAGVLVNTFPEKKSSPESLENLMVPHEHDHEHDHDHASGSCCSGEAREPDGNMVARLLFGMKYAFGDMIGDIGRWLILGVVIAGVITAAIPQDAITQYIGSEWLTYIVMLLVALPLYVCATASTPIAASLLLKGLSPGAALVFLLAGPATNGATITVMLKTLGKRAAGLYVLSIIICSLVLAYLVDHLYLALGLDIRAVVSEVSETMPYWVGVVSGIVLLLLVAKSFIGPSGSG